MHADNLEHGRRLEGASEHEIGVERNLDVEEPFRFTNRLCATLCPL